MSYKFKNILESHRFDDLPYSSDVSWSSMITAERIFLAMVNFVGILLAIIDEDLHKVLLNLGYIISVLFCLHKFHWVYIFTILVYLVYIYSHGLTKAVETEIGLIMCGFIYKCFKFCV